MMLSLQNLKNELLSGDNATYYLLLFLCVLLPFQFALNPREGLDLAVVRVIIPLIFLVWFSYQSKNGDFSFLKNKVTYFFALFLALAISSLFFSQNMAWSMRKLLFLFSIVPLFLVASSTLNTKRRQRGAAAALTLGGAVLALIAIAQFFSQFIFGIDPVYNFLAKHVSPLFLGNSFSQSVLSHPSWLVNAGGTTYMRAVAMFPDPHMLSYYFGMLVPWAAALWATSKNYSRWFLFSALILIVADILTFTRGGYVALIAGALIALPLVSRDAAKKILAACAVVAFLFFVAPHNPVSDRFSSSFDVTEGSNQGRISNWKQALSIILKNPLGVGIGMYPLHVDPSASYRTPIYAHNLYLDIAAELGVVAVLFFAMILFFTLASFWTASKEQPFFIAGVSSVTIFAVHSLVETPLYSIHILSLVCTLIGLGIAINHNWQKQ